MQQNKVSCETFERHGMEKSCQSSTEDMLGIKTAGHSRTEIFFY